MPATQSRRCSLTAWRCSCRTWCGRLRTRRRLAGRQRAARWARERCTRHRIARYVLQRDKQLVQLWQPAASTLLSLLGRPGSISAHPPATAIYLCCMRLRVAFNIACRASRRTLGIQVRLAASKERCSSKVTGMCLHPLARSSSQRCANSFAAWLRAISLADASSASCASGKTASD